MDERHGRETASHFDIPHLGLIGVLIDAKANRHIEAIQPHLDALQREAGFWISDDLYRRVLRDEGEFQ
ncbi:putative nucleic acid-binding protein [Salinibacter ruber]|nr:DUF3368 domain-containing protein [Salinibacter ruber]MCS4143809.1 putative nucleic acid-binding protein [Salinibacter ruber]